MAIAQKRSLLDVFVAEPLELVKAQPHQILLSTGSVAIMAQFAASSGIVDPLVGYCIAGGVEWAYLRGLASDSRARSWWGDALNWSAFAIVVLWGVLWVARVNGVIAEHSSGIEGWLLAVAHIVPIAWLSLCAAMCHRASLVVEAKEYAVTVAREDARQRQIQAERDKIALEDEAKRRELERWKELQLFKKQVAATQVTQPPQPVARAQPVTYEGIEYGSITAAAEALGISRQAMRKRLDKVARNQDRNQGEA